MGASLLLLRFSLSLTLGILFMMCLGVGFFGFILFWGTLCAFYVYFLHQVREVFHHYFFKQVYNPSISLFSFWYPYDVNVGMIDVVPDTPETIIIFQILFSFCSSDWVFLATLPGCVGSGASWEGIWYRSKSAPASTWFGAPWHELQSDMLMVAPCAGLGGTWERPSWEPRPAATRARLGAPACLGFVKLWEVLGKSATWNEIPRLYEKGSGSSLGGPVSWVGQRSQGITRQVQLC